MLLLINFFDGGSSGRIGGWGGTSGSSPTWHTTWHTSGTSSTSHFLKDRHRNAFKLLLLFFVFFLLCGRVAVEPADSLLNLAFQSGLVSRVHLGGNFVATDRTLEGLAVVLE